MTTALVAVAALSACGGEATTTTSPASNPAEGAASDASSSSACEALPTAAVVKRLKAAGGGSRRLGRSGADSLGLATCEWRERSGAEVYISVSIDTAPQTARRYYNLIAEARQVATFDATPASLRPRGVRDVGNDSTHGGAGAYWVPGRSQLNAIARGELVKVGFHAIGVRADAARTAAIELARRALRP